MDKLQQVKNGQVNYFGYNLVDLANKYGTPLKLTFLDIIGYRIDNLINIFDKVIKENKYQGKFVYFNANKANYGALEVNEAFKHSDGLETSSYYDLLYVNEFYKIHPELQHKPILCNGYKPNDYLNAILETHYKGLDITNVIDSMDEYERLKALKINLKVGLRCHIKALYTEEGDDIENDRFGLMPEEIDYILNDLKNTNLILTTIHFHQRGFVYEEDKFIENFEKVFEVYAKAASMYDSVINYDMGGGTPLPNSDDFDYESWANLIIKSLSQLSKKYGVKEPNILSENGKYSQKDGTINIYKVVAKKYTDPKPWYIVDGSLLIALPEMYAINEPIEVKPINELDKKMIKGRLAGVTCDCDDVYEEKDKGYILLPESDNDIFIGCIGTGSYQNSMNGKGGVHHCLLPEEIDVVLYTENGVKKELVRNNLQSIEDIMKKTKFELCK